MQLIKNYLYNAWYQIFVIIVPLITTPYISRVLGAHGVGVNAYTSSIVQFFVILGGLGINLYGNREIAYVRHDRHRLSQLFWEIEALRIGAIVIGLAIFGGYLLLTSKYRIQLILQAFLLIATGLDISWFFMGQEDFKRIVLKNVWVKVLSVILILLFVKSPRDLNWYILIISGSTLLGNLALWQPLVKMVDLVPIRKERVFLHLRPALVLLVPQVASQIYLVLNKTMLGRMVSVTATGYFDNSDKVVKLIVSIVTATGTVMLPRIAATFKAGDRQKVNAYLYATFDFVTALSVPLTLGLMAVASSVAPYFFGSGFNGIDKIIMLEAPVILIIAWSNVLGVQYLLPTKQNRAYTRSIILGAVVNVVCNVPLIHWWGTAGACVATILSELTITVIQLYDLRHQINIRQLFAGSWQYWCAGVVMFIVVYGIAGRTSRSVGMLIVEIFTGIVVYVGLLWLVRAPIILKLKQQAVQFFN